MRIDANTYVKNYNGPSERYYEAMDRFDRILSEKMGINNEPYNVLSNYADSSTYDEFNLPSNSILKSTAIDDPNLKNLSEGERNSNESTGIADFYSKIKNTTVPSAKNGLADTSDIRKKSNATVSTLNQKLAGSRLAGMGEHFKRAEDLYGVNAYVLMAIAKLESNWGQSRIAQEKKNLFGFGAYDSSPYESAKTYSSYQESIYDVAKHLSESYLRPSGRYFNGYSLEAVNIKYCTSPDWASKVVRIVGELTK